MESLERTSATGREDSKAQHSVIKISVSHFKQITQSKLTATFLQEKKDNNCLFGKSSRHETRDCMSTVPSKEKKLSKEGGRHFCCTKDRHISRRCGASSSCSHCGWRHASTMCDPSATGTIPKEIQRDVKGATTTPVSF